MNEYQQREHDKAALIHAELTLIAAAMGWTLPDMNPDAENAPRMFWMQGPDGLEIRAGALGNKSDRLEFTASEWPTHTDKNGEDVRVTPRELGSEWRGDTFTERETAPTTQAARGRPAELIAKQIKARIIPEYKRIYALLREVADSRQAYATSEAGTIARLFKACQDTPRRGDNKPRAVRNMPGDSIYLDYRSPGSIKIELSCDDMCAVIEYLRARRGEV